ncbi:MAG: Fmu (Sun) domain-containing protein, partial [Desulfovibrionaceae bacterium]|nr:Fmu (Sun) domain-containing protein [Desulfovibrionaceae bacterium]
MPNKKIAKALSPARRLALRALLAMQARNEKLQAALNTALSAAPADTSREDKALCTNLVYGCIRLEIRLDWILDQYFSRPESVPLAMRRVMRMAVYELLYLSHIPVYASISSYVGAVRAGYGPAMAGLANAVLRKIAGSGAGSRAWFEQRLSDERAFGKVWYSLPEWMFDHFTGCYPPESALACMEAGLKFPPVGVRANPLAAAYPQVCEELARADGLLAQANNAFAYASGQGPELGMMLARGEVSRQSYAAQAAMQAVFSSIKGSLASALKSGPIWDVCAGQGGKTCWMLEQGLPVAAASDTSLLRLKHLRLELDRLHLPRPVIFAADAAHPLPLREKPGVILIDAPCSGLGTLARRPDIKLYRHQHDLAQLARLQQTILAAQYSSLPQGGLLIYLTCTLNPAENEQA